MAEAELGLLLLNLVHEIVRIGPFEGTLKKDCTDLTRRISLLSHLCEEIREFKGDLLPSGSSSSQYFSCLEDLVAALKASKNLLLVAFNSDSKILLDDSSKKIAFEFQSVTWQLERALGNLPYNHFDISDEVCEQVELVRAQLRRATERYGPLNSKLLSRTSSQPLHSERHLQKLGSRVISRLRFGNISNLGDDFVQKSNYTTGHNMEQMMQESETTGNFSSSSEAYNLNEFYTIEAEKLANKSSEEIKKPDSIVIPDDFRCPISLEVMRDPVIVSTGQTYERSFIQRWIDCGNKTCPKTQQVLPDLTLTPNYVLRSLITQWCEKHKIDPPMGSVNRRIRKSDGSFHEVCGDRESINALVRKLSSRSVDERRSAATEIRSLSKRSTDNRILIAEAGAIPVLVNLLTTEDVRTQENAVTSILNLSIYENNKGRIMLAGAVPSIVQVLRMGSMEARENSAATLFSLSLLDENKITIGASGAIPDLVELLQNGSSRGKKDAATALFNLCIYQGNKGRAVRAGILVPLTKMLTDSSSSMVDEALTILSVLASHQEGKAAIVKASVIPVLIDLMRTGLPRNKENAAAILLALCKKDAENLACIGRLGAVIPLTELAKSGTERAQRKATSLLEHLRKLQQL